MGKKLSQVEWEKLDRDLAGGDIWERLQVRAWHYRVLLLADAHTHPEFMWGLKHEDMAWVKSLPLRRKSQDFWCSVFEQMYHDAKEAKTAVHPATAFCAVWGDFC